VCYDGSSGNVFPAGDDIPIESRILNVVSTYVWDERMVGAVLAYDTLVRESGKALDPIVVGAFRSVLTSTRVAEGKPLAGIHS
jgi:HD-GYP domain-containing protein (c-di-GMP phosphodiesterase class II)